MSAPPRTEFQSRRGLVSAKGVVFSFAWALHRFCGITLQRPEFQGPLPNIGALRATILRVFPAPDAFFECAGQPVFPEWEADFLIGSLAGNPFGEGGDPVPHVLCKDPRLCAGVLSRCAGTLYLARRVPELTWDRLLVSHVLFDDPLITL